jgi:hypothetical protein
MFWEFTMAYTIYPAANPLKTIDKKEKKSRKHRFLDIFCTLNNTAYTGLNKTNYSWDLFQIN